MNNEIYNHKIDACNSVVVVSRGTQFEICIMDYNAVCRRRAMLITEGVFLWDYAPTFDSTKEAIKYVKNNIHNFV